MDYVAHFRREVAAFEAAARVAAGFETAPAVPSCPEWVMTDLVLHLGVVHRYVARIIRDRMRQPPEYTRARRTCGSDRWDAENAVGEAKPIDAALAADAVGQSLEIMAPMRRARVKAPPGRGERFSFRRADGPETWAVRFDGDAMLLGEAEGHDDVQISGNASDLALFLWQRPVSGTLDVQGDTSLLSRYFDLVPPL